MVAFNASIPSVVHQMVLEVANDQANNVGDGTSTAALLVAYLYNHLINDKVLIENYTPSQINSAMRYLQSELETALTDCAISMRNQVSGELDTNLVESLLKTTLNDNMELVELLSNVCKNTAGFEDTNILIDYSNTSFSHSNVIHGIATIGKLMSPSFGNVDKDICNLKNAEVLIIDGKVNIMNDILTYVNKLKTQNKSL